MRTQRSVVPRGRRSDIRQRSRSDLASEPSESGDVANRDAPPPRRDEPLLAERRERSGDGLAGRGDQTGDLILRDRDAQLHGRVVVVDLTVIGQIQQDGSETVRGIERARLGPPPIGPNESSDRVPQERQRGTRVGFEERDEGDGSDGPHAARLEGGHRGRAGRPSHRFPVPGEIANADHREKYVPAICGAHHHLGPAVEMDHDVARMRALEHHSGAPGIPTVVSEPKEVIPVGSGEHAGESGRSPFPRLVHQMSHSLSIVWGGGRMAVGASSRDHPLDPGPMCPSEELMTTQTFPADNDPDTIAVHNPIHHELTSPSSPRTRRSRRVRRAAAIVAGSAVVLATFGVTRQIRADDDAPAVVPKPATEADLLLAAEWARRMEILTPERYRTSPRPASYTDLRLAAEGARYLESVRSASPQETSGGR
jgi:hypothetical protein